MENRYNGCFISRTSRLIILFGVAAIIASSVYFLQLHPSPKNRKILPKFYQKLDLLKSESSHRQDQTTETPVTKSPLFNISDIHRQYAFTIDSPRDVIVFVHIQKTGGSTFGRALVHQLDVDPPCQCREREEAYTICPCYSSDGTTQWLFSRYSTGWVCGLHADFTSWSECLKSGRADEVEGLKRTRRFLYITMLREPLARYMSEYQHVKRGATWSTYKPRCLDQEYNIPPCYDHDDWSGVNISEFNSCPHNLAINRQTRMLANLTTINCYKHFGEPNFAIDNRMLESAKQNLRDLAFFGLIEHLEKSQYVFEKTFNLKFQDSLARTMLPKHNHKSAARVDDFSHFIQNDIITHNRLDIQLYDYAEKLFLARYEHLKHLEILKT